MTKEIIKTAVFTTAGIALAVGAKIVEKEGIEKIFGLITKTYKIVKN